MTGIIPPISDAGPRRFTDKNELKYSLRSLVKFAPWVRKVYILTNGEIPHWLNIKHKRIELVTTAEVFQNASHLPSFNSAAIEGNMHNIHGISEHFLYFCDDFFLGMSISPADFITDSGEYKLYFLGDFLPGCGVDCGSAYDASLNHVDQIYSKEFGTMSRHVLPHMPILVNTTIIRHLHER